MKKNIDIYYILSILMPIVLISMAYFHNRTLFLLVTILAVGCIRRPDAIFPVYFTSSISNAYFSLGEGQSAGRYLSVILISSLLFYVIRQKRDSMRNEYFPLIFLLFICAITSSMYGKTMTMEPFYEMAQNLCVLTLLPMVKMEDIRKCYSALTITSIILVVVVLTQAYTDKSFMAGMRFNVDGEVNANRVGMMIAQCTAFFSAYFICTTSKNIKIALLFFYVLGIFVILTTGSRSALIAALSAMICSNLLGMMKNKKKILLPLLMLLVAGFFVTDYLESVNSPLLDRFTIEEVQASGGTGRAENIRIIMTEIFPDNALLGSGIGGKNMMALGWAYSLPNLAHNIVIDPLSQLGVIFYIFFMAVIILIVRQPFKLRNDSDMFIFALVLFLTSCFNGVGETIFYEKFFWNEIAICLWCTNLYRENLLPKSF